MTVDSQHSEGIDRGTKHVVMVVANGVTGDSRVQKTARSAREAGFEVTVIGISRSGGRTVEELDGVRVVRVPLAYAKTTAVRRGRQLDRRSVARRTKTLAKSEMKLRRARVTRTQEHLNDLLAAGAGKVATLPFRMFIWADEASLIATKAAMAGVKRAAQREESAALRAPAQTDRETAQQARELYRATLSDIGSAFLAELEQLSFDLIHAHDFTMIECGRMATDAAATAGGRPRFVYDAHEWVRGLTYLPAGRQEVGLEAEAHNIGAADAVLTVSPVLAERLRHENSLDMTPEVVLNAPVGEAFDASSEHSVRGAAGLSHDTPLAVYSGGVHESRGVTTLVEALTFLPAVHLAIVAGSPESAGVIELLSNAERLGCADRVHVVPYVGTDEVASYLRTADVGIHPILPSGNAELALPTKLFEYLHAGLPMVVSDMPSMAGAVREHGWGEVFTSGDAQSLAEALRKVLGNPGSYTAALEDEQTRARFSWERQAETLVRTYDRLIFGRAPAEAGAGTLRESVEAPS